MRDVASPEEAQLEAGPRLQHRRRQIRPMKQEAVEQQRVAWP
jgi:hypothetical protein